MCIILCFYRVSLNCPTGGINYIGNFVYNFPNVTVNWKIKEFTILVSGVSCEYKDTVHVCGKVEVKVTTKVSIENVEIGVADKEQSSSPRTTKYVLNTSHFYGDCSVLCCKMKGFM